MKTPDKGSAKGGKKGKKTYGKKGVPKAFERFAKKDSVKVEIKKEKRAAAKKKKVEERPGIQADFSGEPMRLNRFIASAGVCSRREADTLIEAGLVKVNGKVAREMGIKVVPGKDKVEYGGKVLEPQQSFIYLLMNKPKNHITTLSDEKGRRTVMDVVRKYTKERVFPVGRLDRNTTGLLLFTNDGKLAEKLSHPSYEVRKLYHVRLDREVAQEDLDQLLAGVKLEDGMVKADKASYVVGKPMNEVGVQLHSGKNRVVRRLFETLGYQVDGLDRVGLGPLTKKNIPRGKCRFLSAKEVSFLKMM